MVTSVVIALHFRKSQLELQAEVRCTGGNTASLPVPFSLHFLCDRQQMLYRQLSTR